MTTFDQALANLQNSNNQRAAEARGFNNDVARFQTQRANDTARLFMLAGEIGKDIANRLAERKIKEEKHEELYKLFNQKYLGKFDADPKFKENVAELSGDQVTLSNAFGEAEKKGVVSPYFAIEGITETGIGDRATEVTRLTNKALEYRPWIANQIRNNEGTFTAVLYDPQTKGYTQQVLRINDPDLTRDQQLARLQYLTKQFVSKTADGYDPKFLTYDQKNGGSGYAMSIMSQNDIIKKEIEKNIVIKRGINDRNTAMEIFQNPEASFEDIEEAYTLIMNSGDKKGNGIMPRDKAWDFIHDDIMKPSIKNGYIKHPRLNELVQMKFIKKDGKLVSLEDYDKARYGRFDEQSGIQGSMFTEADAAETKRNEVVEERNENHANSEYENLLKRIDNKELTVDLVNDEGKDVVREELQRIWKIYHKIGKGSEFNIAEKLDEIRSRPNERSEAKAEIKVDAYYSTSIGSGLLMEDAAKKFPKDVAASPKIQSIIQIQKKLYDDNKEQIDSFEDFFKTTEIDSTGVTYKDWKHPSAQTIWRLTKGQLIRELEANDTLKEGKKNPITIINEWAVKIAEETTEVKLGATWDEYLEDPSDYGDEAYQKKINTSIYAADANGVYRNAQRHGELENNFTNVWTYRMGLQDKDFSSPDTVIKEEKPYITKYPLEKDGTTVLDWNKYVQSEEFTVATDLRDIAEIQGKSLAQYILERATSSKQTLDEDTKKILQISTLEKLDSKTTKVIGNGNKNGHLTNVELNANLVNNSNEAGIGNDTEGREKITDAISLYMCGGCIDPNGDWKAGFEEYGKLNLGLGMGLLKSMSETASDDFSPDGANSFFEVTKDISKEDMLLSIYNNPIAAFEAAKYSGDLSYLPKEDSPLLDNKKQTDYLKILDILSQSLDNTQANPYIKD